MKKPLTTIVLASLALASAGAQEGMDLMSPKDPRGMAMGGAFVAMSSGYQSLFGNPASYADTRAELTVVTANPWIYVSPTQANIATVEGALAGPSEDLIPALSDLITANGIGAGSSAGLGWVGRGLGLGVLANVEAYVRGPNALGAMGTADGQVAGVVGVGFPLQLFGLRLSVGGDLRPFLRLSGPISSQQLGDLVSGADPMTVLADLPVYAGFGLAADLGARLDFGSFASVGVVIRDIATRQTFIESTFSQVGADLSGESAVAPATADFTLLPNITVGASLRPLPAGMRGILDLLLVLELQDPIGVIEDKATFWHLLHVGAEAELFGGLVALRAGLNRGYASLGFGLDLFVAEANVAVFTEELGKRPGDMPRTGVSAELAIRF